MSLPLRTVTLTAIIGLFALQAASAQSSRPRANDAYRPSEQGPGLGVLNSDGTAAPAPAYGSQPAAAAPQYSAPGYAGAGQAPTYQAPSYSEAPPPYTPPYSSQYRAAPTAAPPFAAAPSYTPSPTYTQAPSQGGNDSYRPPSDGGTSGNGGFGQPYAPPPNANETRPYASGDNPPPPYRSRDNYRGDGTYSTDEIKGAGHQFFGSISQGLASVIEHAFRKQGRPNGYILGEDAGGAFIAGLRYGQGTLYTKDAGSYPVYWQGPSLGFDYGAEGSKTMILVYNLRDTRDIYDRFGGVAGSAYLIGGVGITFLGKDHITMAPIRSGIGLRLGANIGYLKFSHEPTWNPF